MEWNDMNDMRRGVWMCEVEGWVCSGMKGELVVLEGVV
jgi:hypothetical protein